LAGFAFRVSRSGLKKDTLLTRNQPETRNAKPETDQVNQDSFDRTVTNILQTEQKIAPKVIDSVEIGAYYTV